MTSQITSLTIVYSTVYWGVDQRKHQSSASLAFVRGIHRGPVNSPHKWPVTRNMFPFDDVIMLIQTITKRWEPRLFVVTFTLEDSCSLSNTPFVPCIHLIPRVVTMLTLPPLVASEVAIMKTSYIEADSKVCIIDFCECIDTKSLFGREN